MANLHLTTGSEGPEIKSDQSPDLDAMDISIVFSGIPGKECVYAYGGTISIMREKMFLYDFFRRNNLKNKASSLRMITARSTLGFLTRDDLEKARFDNQHARFVIDLVMAAASQH